MKFHSIAALGLILVFVSAGRAQTTVFTYQGQLMSNSVPANGLYDLRFRLLNDNTNPVAGPLTNSPTGVTNGSFLVDLNFGSAVFDGSGRWLEIAVRGYGETNSYTALSPLQQITSSPYAIRALNAGSASNAVSLVAPLQGTNIVGTVPATNLPPNVAYLNSNQVFTASNTFNGAVTASNAANSFAGTFAGNGAGLTSLTATNLSGTVPDARLSPNVALLNNTNNANLVFSASITATNFIGAGHGLTNVPGAFFWVTLTTNAQALPNVGYICTNNLYPVTVTLPATPSVGDVFRVAGVGGAGWIVGQTNGQSILAGNLANSAGMNWTARSGNGAWAGIACSADGSKMAACLRGNTIGLSVNSGMTWGASGSISANWSSVASSADGTKLVGVVGDNMGGTGTIYTNDNSGVGTWTSRPYSEPWVSVASSADGARLIAAAYGNNSSGDGVYISSNSGGTWSQNLSTTYYCAAVASSADGTKYALGIFSGVYQGIYTSTNSGANWTWQTNLANVVALACSSDGSRLVAAVAPTSGSGQLFTSSNGGATWVTTSPSQKWTAVASSADGSRLAAVGSDGSVYTSLDSGTTWIQSTVIPSNLSWAGVTMSANGSVMAITANPGAIYTSGMGSTTMGTNGYLFGAQQATIELNYVGNGVFIPLSHEGTIRAY